MVSNGVSDHLQCHQFMVCQRDVKECQRKVEDVEPLNVRFVTMMKELREWWVLSGATGVQFADV